MSVRQSAEGTMPWSALQVNIWLSAEQSADIAGDYVRLEASLRLRRITGGSERVRLMSLHLLACVRCKFGTGRSRAPRKVTNGAHRFVGGQGRETPELTCY
jgi:hypothetical protein